MTRLTLLTTTLVAVTHCAPTVGRAGPGASLFRSRRSAITLAGGAAAGAVASSVAPVAAAEPTVKVYFGAGCFWHVQHEFVGEEVAALRRSPATITAVSGYAGGQRLGPNNKICYHNMNNFADYGKLGHAEAVQLEVPQSSFPRFCKKYFDLFGSRGYRHDPQDRGGEYRSVLGLPGGTKSPYYSKFLAAAEGSPMKLVEGKGSEDDTLGTREILVMDSDKFPFYRAELYHQFHNDFQGPAYGTAYNRLQRVLAKEGRLGTTGCPEEAF